MIPWFTASTDYETLGSTQVVFSHYAGSVLIDPLAGVARLLINTSLDHAVTLSPDGARTAFAVDRLFGTEEIHVRNTDGTSQRLLASLTGRTITQFVWSGDGQYIYFVTGPYYGDFPTRTISIQRLASSGQPNVQLLRSFTTRSVGVLGGIDVRQNGDVLFAFKDEGDVFVYVQRVVGALDTLYQIGGTSPTELSAPLADPVWSPSGEMIAFLSFSTGAAAPGDETTAIKIMQANGSNMSTIYSRQGALPWFMAYAKDWYTGLCWSGDGSRIMLLLPENDGKAYEIRSVKLDGTGLRTIVAIDRTVQPANPYEAIREFSCSAG